MIGGSGCETWIYTSELDSVERWRSGVLLSVERRSSWTMYQDLGIPMKIEIQCDSSTANSLTDRLGAGQRTKHIDTRYFWVQERVRDGDLRCLQRKIVQMLERSQSLSQYYNNLARLQDWCSTDHGSRTPLQDEGTSFDSSRYWTCKTETDNCQHWS